jgi:1,2-diacylglycerol 3-beta-galactosyltransferase
MQKTIMILTADAGYGHRAASLAIAQALKQLYGDECNAPIVNPLDDRRTPSLLRRTQTDYDKVVNQAPEFYRVGYEATDTALPISLGEQALVLALFATMRDLVNQYKPDAIVSTHPFYQEPLGAVFAVNRAWPPLLAVVTDLITVHGLWFSDEIDILAVPSDDVRARAIESGIPPARVRLTGLPVSPTFAEASDRRLLREALGWSQDRTVVLMVGSKRVQKLVPYSNILNHSALPLELALVAGGNEELRREWEQETWHLPAHVYGFVTNLHDMIKAADIIACKAGGLIVTESLAAGRPLLIVEAIPGQETGNAEYVMRGGAGVLLDGPVHGLETVYHWLEDDAAGLAQVSAAAAAIGYPEASLDVARLAWQAALHGPYARERSLVDRIPLLGELLGRGSA